MLFARESRKSASGLLPRLQTSKKNKTIALIVFVVLVMWLIWSGALFSRPPPPPPPPPPLPDFEVYGLKHMGPSVEVATVYMHAETSDRAAPVNHKLDIAMPAFATVQLENPGVANTGTAEAQIAGYAAHSATATVSVAPIRAPADASSIIFGAATTLSRMTEALEGFRHWASHTGARFVFIVEPNTPDKPEEPSSAQIIQLYRQHGISLTLVESPDEYIDRYVGLIGVLYAHLEPKTEWVAFIDDDTFFFDMETVMSMLKKYDPVRESLYVGTTSENKWNINDGGIFGIGGAGFFLSAPLIRQIGPHSAECVAIDNIYGDSRVADCVFKYTPTKLSMEHDLYQLDLHGDVTGFYEAVRRQPVGVHHWKTWHHHDMPLTAAVSSVCGRPCVLQSYTFADGWQMTNGFSIVRYSYSQTQLASQIESAMEHTWKLTIWDIPDSWKYSLEPLKPRDEGKIQYLIEAAVDGPTQDEMTLFYVRRREGVGEGVIRVIWSRE